MNYGNLQEIFKEAGPAALKPLLTRFTPPTGRAADPIRLQPDECSAFIELFAHVVLGKGERPGRECLSNTNVHAGLQRAAESQVGTHNPKVPSSNVIMGPLFDLRPGEGLRMPPGVSHRTVQTLRRTGSSGNAADAAYMGFLALELTVDGVHQSVSAHLAERNALWAALVETGMPQTAADTLADTLHRRLHTSSPAPIDRFVKQLYWPMSDGYILVSPLQAEGLRAELEQRLRVRTRAPKGQKPQQRLSTVETRIGGANPINAGQLNAEIGGLHSHLLCLPPVGTRDDPASRLARLALRGTPFHPRLIDKEIMAALVGAYHDRRDNRAAKDRWERSVARAVDAALEPALALAEEIRSQPSSPLNEPRFTRVPAFLRLWLDPRSGHEGERMAGQIYAQLARHIYIKTFRDHPYPAWREIDKGDVLELEFLEAIRQALGVKA